MQSTAAFFADSLDGEELTQRRLPLRTIHVFLDPDQIFKADRADHKLFQVIRLRVLFDRVVSADGLDFPHKIQLPIRRHECKVTPQPERQLIDPEWEIRRSASWRRLDLPQSRRETPKVLCVPSIAKIRIKGRQRTAVQRRRLAV